MTEDHPAMIAARGSLKAAQAGLTRMPGST